MKRILLFWLLLVWFTNGSNAQSIRKDYREMTGAEMNEYVQALNTMRSTGLGNNPANHHGAGNWIDFFGISHGVHFDSPIHSGQRNGNGRWFLPWHRVFLLEFERALKQLSGRNYLSIPYWDSRDDRNTGSSTFWHNGFLAPSRLTWTVSRNFGGGTLASANTVNNILNQTTFINANGIRDNFSRHLEYDHHNEGHAWIGGTMNSGQSPLDPIFFLHHCMVDKLWDDWEERQPFTQSDIAINGGNLETMTHYSIAEGYRDNINPNNMYVRGKLTIPYYANEQPPFTISGGRGETWYSDYATRSVVIHGFGSNSAFQMNDVASYPYEYRYVSATTTGGSGVTGTIYLGSLKRNNGQVEASDWGGVLVNSGTTCNLKAGGAVVFMPGFEANYGSNVSATIINTHSSNRQSAENSTLLSESVDEREQLLLFPNPTSESITLKIPSTLQGNLNAEIMDLIGNVVITQNFQSNQSELKCNVSTLKSGLYFCRIVAENGQSSVAKFIKE